MSGMNCKSQTPCSVQHSQREVIEGKLLAALDDESKVAALLSHDDLDVLIRALSDAPANAENVRMLEDFKQLRAVAFGPQNDKAQVREERA
jgi:hypothetical protein